MPKLNRLGQAVTPAVNGPIAIEGSTPAALVGVTGGGCAWLWDHEIVYQRTEGAGVPCLDAYDLATGATRRVADGGANKLVAAAGVWAAHDNRGYRDSLKRAHPDWQVIAIDRQNGDVLIVTDWRNGRGLEVLTVAGAREIVTAGLLDRVDAGTIDDGVVVFYAGGAMRRWTVETGAVRSPVYVVDAALAWPFVAGYVEGFGLSVVHAETGRGVALSGDGKDNWPDIVALDEHLWIVQTSSGPGELPSDQHRKYLVTADECVQDLSRPPMAMPTFERPTRPVCVLGKPGARWRMSWATDPRPDDPTVCGILSSAEGYPNFTDAFRAELATVAAMARRYQRPIFLNVDGFVTLEQFGAFLDRFTVEGVGVIPMFEAYPFEGMTEAQIEALIGVARAKGYPCVGIWIGLYTRHEWSVAQVVAQAGAAWRAAVRAGAAFVALFDWVRPTGITTHPEFLACAEAMLAHSTGPELAPKPFVRPPSGSGPVLPTQPEPARANAIFSRGFRMGAKKVEVRLRMFVDGLPGPYLSVNAVTGELYADRPKAEGWERFELRSHDKRDEIDVLAIEANRQVAVDDNGRLAGTRDPGTFGPWEQFKGFYLGPKDDKSVPHILIAERERATAFFYVEVV